MTIPIGEIQIKLANQRSEFLEGVDEALELYMNRLKSAGEVCHIPANITKEVMDRGYTMYHYHLLNLGEGK